LSNNGIFFDLRSRSTPKDNKTSVFQSKYRIRQMRNLGWIIVLWFQEEVLNIELVLVVMFDTVNWYLLHEI